MMPIAMKTKNGSRRKLLKLFYFSIVEKMEEKMFCPSIRLTCFFFFPSFDIVLKTWHGLALLDRLSLDTCTPTPVTFVSKTVSCMVVWEIPACRLNLPNTITSCWFNVGRCANRSNWMLNTLIHLPPKPIRAARPTNTTVFDHNC